MMHKRILIGLAVLIVLLVFPIAESRAGLAISPGFVEISLDKGRPAGQFVISNLGDEEERYRIRAIHFILTKNGGVNRVAADENSLAPWIKFNPTEFTLAPKTKRVVRYAIIPRGPLRDGEYWAAMELESLRTYAGSGKDSEGREYQLEVIPSILVPIFGTVGKVRYNGSLRELKVTSTEKGQLIKVLLENTGQGRLRIEGGKYEIRNGAGEEIEKGVFGRSYVFPGLDQYFISALKANLKEGVYKVRVEFDSHQLTHPLENEFQLVWKESSK